MATRKITVTVPAEIADKLDHLPNRSAFVTQAVQDKLCREHDEHILDELWGPDWREGITGEHIQWADRVLGIRR